MKFEIELNDQVVNEDPDMRLFVDALQQMVNRMVFSHFKYGNMNAKYPLNARAVDSADKRRDMYEKSGNIENCLDAANFYVIEYLYPSHRKAHFKAQTSAESPGIVWREE